MNYDGIKSKLDHMLENGHVSNKMPNHDSDADLFRYLRENLEVAHLRYFKFDEAKIINYLSIIDGIASSLPLDIDQRWYDYLRNKAVIYNVIHELLKKEEQDEFSYLRLIHKYDTFIRCTDAIETGIADTKVILDIKWATVAEHIRNYLIRHYKEFEATNQRNVSPNPDRPCPMCNQNCNNEDDMSTNSSNPTTVHVENTKPQNNSVFPKVDYDNIPMRYENVIKRTAVRYVNRPLIVEVLYNAYCASKSLNNNFVYETFNIPIKELITCDDEIGLYGRLIIYYHSLRFKYHMHELSQKMSASSYVAIIDAIIDFIIFNYRTYTISAINVITKDYQEKVDRMRADYYHFV